jgi:hypothetical protein
MVVEGEKPLFTRRRLVKVYGESTVDLKAFRRGVRQIKVAERGVAVMTKARMVAFALR